MISVEQLTKVYGATRAIDQVSFEVDKGEVVGFLGPNGAGKSTTMRILAGALGATSGHARIGGIDVLEQPREVKKLVGYLPERPPLYEEMTVRGYLRFCARLRDTDNAAVESAIERTGLVPVAHRLIQHCSKGYRQRVGIAQAIVHTPKVLILDEPVSGLDPAQRVEIRNLIRELAAADTTVILSTHVLPEVEAICDRVVIIQNGKIQLTGDIASVGQSVNAIRVLVARYEPVLQEGLAAIEGVSSVEITGKGRLRVVSDVDVREQVAMEAVKYGLLELRADKNLEDVFLEVSAGAS